MKVNILTLNKPNKNNNLYSSEVVENMIQKLEGKSIPVTSNVGNGTEPNIAQIVATADTFKVEGDTLTCDVQFLALPHCAHFSYMLDCEKIGVRPSLCANVETVDGNHVVKDPVLNYLFLTNDPA